MRSRICKCCGMISILVACFGLDLPGEAVSPPAMEWPEITKECRPWTYWWWLGSAVNPEELTRHLEAYREEGMGGVHIVPIYGAKGYEDRYISYLTPKWMEMLAHTVREAGRLGMGVDMTTGTGWPFGGPWVEPEDASARALFETFSLTERTLTEPVRSKEQPEAVLQSLMAFSSTGNILDLTDKVDSEGTLKWEAPAGEWRLYAVFQGWTRQKVKRAAPGAEGFVLDYFSKAKLERYLSRFDEAFETYDGPPVRAFYNDSFEVYRANWTDNLLAEFARRMGYDLRRELPALLGEGDPDRVSRVRSDYRETMYNLLYEEFTQPWVQWCHSQGSLSRNQGHGSPGSLIDLYSVADIPETEGFGPGGVEILVAKLASSASHLHNKPRTSSETCTWLGEHFQVSLARVKQAVDPYFLAGINHIFYHGMPFSPKDVPFPGWLFYASTHFGLTNTFSRDFSELNRYIARCQSFLQAGKPGNDLLLYFPIYDLWSKEHGSKDLLQYCNAHNTDDWLRTNLKPTYEAATWMWDHGYAFDYVSDRILKENLSVSATLGGITNGESVYRAVIVSGCQLMPVETLESLIRLAEQGGTVIFVGGLPADVPGWWNLEKRHGQRDNLLQKIDLRNTDKAGIQEDRIGKGRILLGDDLESLLTETSAFPMRIAEQGIFCVRRIHEEWIDFFFVNQGDKAYDDWLPVGIGDGSVVLFDPLREKSGIAKIRRPERGREEVRLQLEPGDSCVLRVVPEAVTGDAWQYKKPGPPIACFTNPWEVEFIEGGPALPQPWRTTELRSWTENGDASARDFSGTGRYRTTFVRPSGDPQGWILDLGRICESARVYLNGENVGTLWCEPFRIDLGQALQSGKNTLEIEVTNLMANRIAAMDRAKIPWHEYFFVNIDYKDFDASSWETLPSGLLGPVNLIPYALEE
ncbi:MAG: glycosyl hydrolase [bacterium]